MISAVSREKSNDGKRIWLMAVDCATPKKYSFFLKSKSEQYNVIINLLRESKKHNVSIKGLKLADQIMCMDNSGENKNWRRN